jgi:hypothetical protein
MTGLFFHPQLIESTMTMPGGLSPELEEAIEKFQGEKKARERKMKELEEKAEAGGVKGPQWSLCRFTSALETLARKQFFVAVRWGGSAQETAVAGCVVCVP